MNSPLVSIIMPAYNVEKYIDDSISSVVNQEYKNWELLIVDDCSTDTTSEIIDKFVKIDSRIVLLSNKINTGTPAKAKNKAIPFVRGKYIAFLDSDDIWFADKLIKQIKLMEDNFNYALTYTGGYWIDENNNEIKRFLPKYKCGNILSCMLKRYEINNQSVVIRKEVLSDTIGLFNETIVIGEDYNLFMNIVAKYEVCNIKEHLVKYRVHEKSITKNGKSDLSDGTLKTLKELNIKYKIKLTYPLCYLVTWLKAIRFKFKR